MSEITKTEIPIWKRILLPKLLLEKSPARQLAYVGVMTALCIIANMWEIKQLDFQFSITIYASVMAGIFIGPLLGFVASFLGDFLGFVVNSWGLTYYWWVALSCGMMAVIAGLVMRIPFRVRGSLYIKLAIVSVLVVAVCSVGINTTGLYLWNKFSGIGFGSIFPVIEEHFGGQLSYWTYAIARLVFKGQLVNNLLNFALLYITLPALCAIKPLKLHLK